MPRSIGIDYGFIPPTITMYGVRTHKSKTTEQLKREEALAEKYSENTAWVSLVDEINSALNKELDEKLDIETWAANTEDN